MQGVFVSKLSKARVTPRIADTDRTGIWDYGSRIGCQPITDEPLVYNWLDYDPRSAISIRSASAIRSVTRALGFEWLVVGWVAHFFLARFAFRFSHTLGMIDDEVMADEGFFIKVVNDEKGKGLFSNRAFKEGDVILEERPVACCQFLWNSEFGYLACDHCLRPLETAEENVRRLTGNSSFVVPHKECCEINKSLITECPLCGVKYCSTECQNEAFQRYHSTLCLQGRVKDESHPLNQLCETWKQMHYPPENASIMLLARMVAVVNQANDKEEALAMFSQFCHRTVSNDTHEIVHYLLGEKFVGQIDILQQMMKEALNTEYTAHWFTPDGFRSLLALVGTNGQGIGTSSFSRWVKNVSALELPKDERIYIDKLIERIYDAMDEAVGPFLNNEGSGLYVLQSSVNHSCVPNAVVEFPYSNNTLVLKAIRDIKVGEEICTSYLDECQLERSRHSRQQALSSMYLFVCHCDKCKAQANDPDVTSDEEESDED